MAHIRIRFSTVVALLVLGATTACTNVMETTQLHPVAGIACHSSVGGYYLPRAFVRLSVVRAAEGRPGFRLDNETPTLEMVADRRQLYCLDYLASPTSKDVIAVKRNEKGLLTNVLSNVEDRSTQIALTLIKTAELVAGAGLRGTTVGSADPGETADLQFDPFDPLDLKIINKALRRFGFCVYIENHSFPEGHVSPQSWCTDPWQERYVNTYNMMLAETPVAPEAMNSGILYRPNATHKLVVRRRAHNGREPWVLYVTRHIEAPNVSPIFSVGVHRAMFTTRNTKLEFENGVLTNISVDKGSELESFSQIPLAVAQAIVSLPTQIVQLRIDETRGKTSLAEEEARLAIALANLARTRNPEPPRTTVVNRQTELLQQCFDRGATADFCRDAIIGNRQ